MPTSTLWNRGDKLPRHGHPLRDPVTNLIDPAKYNWHFASQIHRTDPDAHEREASFTSPNWARTKGDHHSLSSQELDTLLADARRIYDAALQGTALPPASATPEPAPQASATPAASLPADLAQRLDDAEGATLLAMQHAAQAMEKADIAHNYARQNYLSLQQTVNTQLAAIPDHISKAAGPLRDEIAAIAKRVDATVTHTYVITHPDNATTTATLPQRHRQFDELLELVISLDPHDRNIWIAGPMGSGKTTAASQLAKVLNLGFDFNGPINMDYKLSGYSDGNGRYHDTPFRRQYENGGVWLGDECDGSAPAAMMELNTALSNSHMSFPDKTIDRHATFIALAAANTWGLGGDANYVGRNKQDAAFLDRFVVIEWNYDEDFERTLAMTINPDPVTSTWVDIVQEVRRTLFENRAVGIVISPRSSIKGAQLLRNPRITPAQVVSAIFGRYRNHSMWPTVGKAAEDFAKRTSTPRVTAAPDSLNGAAATKLTLPKVDMTGVKVY